MKEVTKEILQNLLSYMKDTEVLVKKEAPLAIQELIKYKTFMAYLSVCGGFIGFIIFSIIAVVCWQYCPWQSSEISPSGIFLGIGFFIGLVIALTSGITFTCSIPELVKWKMAPRIAILDYLRGK